MRLPSLQFYNKMAACSLPHLKSPASAFRENLRFHSQNRGGKRLNGHMACHQIATQPRLQHAMTIFSHRSRWNVNIFPSILLACRTSKALLQAAAVLQYRPCKHRLHQHQPYSTAASKRTPFCVII